MTALKIGVDIDDVLYPWFELAHELCVEAGITNGVEPTTWSPHDEYGCDVETWLKVLGDATLDGKLYNADPIPGALDALRRLQAAGHTIHLVTARGSFVHGDVIKGQTVLWIIRHAVPHDTLTFSRDKTLVRVDVFVDDSERNIDDLVNAGTRAALITASHNGRYPYPFRFDHIGDFADDLIAHGTRLYD